MPEGLEAQMWCDAAQVLVGRRIDRVWSDERVAPPDLADVLEGSRIEEVVRRGKVLLVETDGATLGVHFGMTGRVEVDGRAPIDRLEYASGDDREEWDRLRLWTSRGGASGHGDSAPALRMNDPRRLGRLSIDPDLSHLGPEAVSLTGPELGERVARRSGPIKSALLDQSVVAGLGNLCADEVLFWAGIAPMRPANGVSAAELGAIARSCRDRLPVMLEAGGSTMGVLSPAVRAGMGPCPHDGAELTRSKVGGRTAVWCVEHQV